MLHDLWQLPPPSENLPRIPIANDKLRAIVARRGVTTEDDFRRFAAPTLDDLHDPAGIHGMAEACGRIERAVRHGQTILIYGDYDVDGVTSIVLLQTVLRTLGADAAHVVPHRLVDGYGLKTEVIERVLVDRAVKLVITVDCGITSVDPVRRALERGIDVIITDHHLPPGILPEAAAVLNPKQPGCAYPFKELAGVGVAFKLCCELVRRNRRKMSIESLLKIAAIGTIADVAPLVGENRTIAWLGLHALAEPRNRGLRALIRRLGLLGKPLRAVDIGFKIGPRINAAGRLASADTAIDLFAAADDDKAWQLCAELDRLNAERQEIEKQVRDAAEQQIEGDERIIIVAGEGWHRGVIGLTAGRIAQRYHRPTLAISIDGEVAVGSARSIPSIDLHAQLDIVHELFTHFGGHQFACGFSLERKNLDALRERLAKQFEAIDGDLFRRIAAIDAELELHEIDRELFAAHEMLQPFGAGNPQPLFLARGVEVVSQRTFADECCEVLLRDANDGRAIAVVWPSAQPLLRDLLRAPSDVLFHLEPDAYAPTGARLNLVDARNSIQP
ncbi:MAG TPA: single-stranded-DNA-specific exonuclease RecJ [Thermoanaerobaculia bacterium]|nr:single-stranded-DNA-specific exonuclease RecJ [Thermoanaerobaculia bacterium]